MRSLISQNEMVVVFPFSLVSIQSHSYIRFEVSSSNKQYISAACLCLRFAFVVTDSCVHIRSFSLSLSLSSSSFTLFHSLYSFRLKEIYASLSLVGVQQTIRTNISILFGACNSLNSTIIVDIFSFCFEYEREDKKYVHVCFFREIEITAVVSVYYWRRRIRNGTKNQTRYVE